jgi:hypothetical protein
MILSKIPNALDAHRDAATETRAAARQPTPKNDFALHDYSLPKKISFIAKLLLNYWRTLISKASHVSQRIFVCQPQIQSESHSAVF